MLATGDSAEMEVNVRVLWVVLLAGAVACGGNSTDETETGDTGATPTPPEPNDDRDGDGFSTADGDCNDQNPLIFPGADEICDGEDNDCDATTPESGATFLQGRNTLVDRTADLAAGTKDKPAVVTLDQEGRLNVCPGTWYVTFDISANARIVGMSSQQGTVVLDGNGLVGGFEIEDGAATQFGLENVTVRNYSKPTDDPEDPSYGGALDCSADGAQVIVQRSTFVGNTASLGGAVAVRGGCEVRFSQTRFEGGSAEAGGHLIVSEAEGNFDQVEFVEGLATVAGGAVAVGSELTPFDADPSRFLCSNCIFSENRAVDDVGGLASGGALWVGSSSDITVSNSEFTDNEADVSGGAVLVESREYEGAEASFEATEFTGNLAAGVANAISVPEVKNGEYDYSGEESVRCDETDGCVEP